MIWWIKKNKKFWTESVETIKWIFTPDNTTKSIL